MSADPFGTEALRASVLRAWRDSPTRFTEDTNAETDLKVGGYRDRLFVELAQNAADAALAVKDPGRLRVSLVDNELRVANTGAPLDVPGVAALASLRASAKQGDTVGTFGVGFAAVLAVTTAPRVVSTSGGVGFSAAETRVAAEREGDVPVLRLPWPVADDEPAVPQGFDTEVRLPLASGVVGAELLASLSDDVPDLLLALPWLSRIEIEDAVWTRSAVEGDIVEIVFPSGTVQRWLTHATESVWAVPVTEDGVPVPLDEDVLHAPTPTDERLSLPARLIASVPIEPSRRRVLAGDETLPVALQAAAAAYPELVRKLPVEHRLALVPAARFPLSEVDSSLRDMVIEQLTRNAWLPLAAGGESTGSRARVLDVESPALVELLAEVVHGLIAAPLTGPAVVRALASVGAEAVGAAEVVEKLTGVDREPGWWHSLYDALLPLLEAHEIIDDELGGLPVPLSDGRTLPGPRGSLLVNGSDELLELLSDVDIAGLRLVHPDAAHPLLERLGAKHAEARDLLEAPALREAVERSVEDALSGMDGMELAGAALRLVAESNSDDFAWLGALALPCADGWRRADELVLPTSPLRKIFDAEVFAEDGPLSVLDEEFAEDWPIETLTAIGVLDKFAVLSDEDPIEADHSLPEEQEWWDSFEEPPTRLVAVRDLDLVADDAWPAALRLLASEPSTWAALTHRDGHTPWWLARFAVLADRIPGEWRLPDASSLAGLYDPVPDLDLTVEVLAAAGVRSKLEVSDVDDVSDLLERLGDPDRTIALGLITRTHTALAETPVNPHDIAAPARVRTVDGTVADAETAVVLDVPWAAAVLSPQRLVASTSGAAKLAELLDLPLAGGLPAEVTSESEYVPWTELAAIGVVAELLDLPLPPGGPLLHEQLTVSVDGTEHTAPWWSDGRLHASDTPEGLAKAFAWAVDRWPDRHLIAALLDDPSPAALLG
ncbi:sacsin N-terminal ATP-binding-like domain-containing protein [Amycolatopsis sp.]|uniref:sacsin N-terminal ATP-binding-like domain-containing protein n=1 Tax=Amycolatopsis sp. TaxID=37632 RepID=UPI002E0709C4|nr:molecular chaperone Hsp90 [Amycolatopsis sp.]